MDCKGSQRGAQTCTEAKLLAAANALEDHTYFNHRLAKHCFNLADKTGARLIRTLSLRFPTKNAHVKSETRYFGSNHGEISCNIHGHKTMDYWPVLSGRCCQKWQSRHGEDIEISIDFRQSHPLSLAHTPFNLTFLNIQSVTMRGEYRPLMGHTGLSIFFANNTLPSWAMKPILIPTWNIELCFAFNGYLLLTP